MDTLIHRYIMEIIIHVEVKKLDKNLQLAIAEYTKRTSPFCRITIKTYKSLDKAEFKYGSKIYNVVSGDNSPTSEGLSKLILDTNLGGVSCIEFIIKNPYNIDSGSQDNEDNQDNQDSQNNTNTQNIIKKSDNLKHAVFEDFNLSSFAMSPDLTAVVLTEQIYRAYTIMNNITYHK